MTQKLLRTALGWTFALLLFFPIGWMIMTSFKSEIDAVASPPLLTFTPTLENYVTVASRADYLHFALNSVVISLLATALSLALALPTAYAMAFFPTAKTRGTLLWILSTKMMPGVGVLIPIYLLARDLRLLDSHALLIVLFALMNLPVVVWMLFSFFREIPVEILEAARIDGADLKAEILRILLPLSLPGIVSTGLLSIILCWNEAFWSINLTTTKAAPLSVFIAAFSAPQGLFWAKLSAAAVMAVGPIMVMGWLGQKQIVRGLTFGAVK